MLRDYQSRQKDEIYDAWRSGARNVLAVAPTGAGKTKLKATIVKEVNAPFCMIAHRQELVSQISLALAREQVRHRVIAPKAIIQFIIRQHIKHTGNNWYNDRADAGVAGVDTLVRAKGATLDWTRRVVYWSTDEAHHLTPNNKWGTATQLFPNAYGLGVTATPVRTDKKPMGRAQGGVFDVMVQGPQMRDLINRGYLSDYRIFVPPASINADEIEISKTTGDFNEHKMRAVSHESTITGDIVRDYMRFGAGKRGITFVVDVDTAKETAAKFKANGVSAEAVSANTPDNVRADFIERFVSGDILQLINVDLFGEGFDVPACEIVSMGRPTQSYGLYVQQFGRALRPANGKTHGIIIDHVGNVIRHGLPDREIEWTFGEIPKRKKRATDELPLTSCIQCFQPYERFRSRCPYCGYKPVPAGRGSIKQVDGDLVELSPEWLAQMRGEVDKISDAPLIPRDVTPMVADAIRKRWNARRAAQDVLRTNIAQWAGVQKHVEGLEDSEIWRKFYLLAGIDMMTAQTLGEPEAKALAIRVQEWE